MMSVRNVPNGFGLLRSLSWVPLLALLVCVPACGDDDGGETTIVIRSDRERLLANGADTATVSVTLLDQNANPPALGTRVTLTLVNPETQDFVGNVNDSGENTGIAQTDTLGIAQFRVACTQPGPMTAIARVDGRNAALNPPIQCSPAPTGAWSVQTTAEPRRVQPRGTTTIVVNGTDENGRPVPEGTPVSLEITGTNLAFLRSGTDRLQLNLAAGGRITTNVLATEGEGTATVCARFADTRLGATPSCVAVVVSDRQLTDAACIATYSSARAPADGRTVTTATFTVSDRNSSPVDAAELRISTAAGTFLDAPNGDGIGTEQTLFTDSNGDASIFIRSPAQAAAADVRAQAIYNEGGTERVLECEFSANLTFFSAPACEYDGVTPSLIGVRDSGISESGRVRFCFYAEQGQPVSAGQRVDFEWQLRLTETEFAARSSLTDSNGCAEVEIRSGTVAGVVEVRATLPFGDNQSTCVSDPVAIRGGRPTERGWGLECDARNACSLLTSAGNEIFSDCTISCTAYLRDRFGNPVNRPDIQVFFASEQGTIVSPITPDDAGRVTTTYRPNGNLPVDVPPLAEEPRLFEVATGNVVNPRDMLVTIIAFTNGEEAFYDTNGNGDYDEGEVFVDLPEPFIDSNDNSAFDPEFPFTERFFDVQTPDRPLNGRWDGPNGRWDRNSVIWTQTAVLLTGSAVGGSLADNGLARDPGSAFSPTHLSHFVFNGQRVQFNSIAGILGGDGFSVVLADRYMNPPSPAGSTISVEASGVCNADMGSNRLPVGPSNQPYGFLYRRNLVSFNAAGNESVGDDVEYQLWRTQIDRFGATNFSGASAPLIGASVPVLVEGNGQCSTTLTWTLNETNFCTAMNITQAARLSFSVPGGL
jgi:hypothetical protein